MWLDCGNNVSERGEVLIVQATAPDQFPDALDRVEFGTVRRQKVQPKVILDLLPPRSMQRGVVVAGIVDNHNHLTPTPTSDAFEFSQESPAGLRIKHAFRSRHAEFSVAETDRPEETDALARRRMPADRIEHFGRNPHAAARAVLLEVNLIEGPEIDVRLSGQAPEFFYARPEVQGPPVPPAVVVCAAGSRVDETVADTAAP